jgi:hypothetical protein
MKRSIAMLRAALAGAVLLLEPSEPSRAEGGDKFVFLPLFIQPETCPAVSTARYGLTGIDGSYYKDNRLTDANADFRLSIIGYAETSAPLMLVDYNGATDANAPKLQGVFEPNRGPAFVKAHRRHDWNWNESAPPPYGARGGINNDWPVSVIDFAATKGEGIYPPERGPTIGGGFVAMVLYAGEEELTLAYYRQDHVALGYVINMVNFCVDPNLVAVYRAQTAGGKRSTGMLPAVANNQRLGVAKDNFVTIAVRDRGAYLDPRSRKDWW